MVKLAGLMLTSNGTSLRRFLRPIVLQGNLGIRKPFRRIFFKKNGAPRSDYSVWLAAVDLERKAATFDPSEGVVRFYPDCDNSRRLNLALLSSGEALLSMTGAESILRRALNYADLNCCILRIFSHRGEFPREWIFSQVNLNSSDSVNLEIVDLPNCHLIHAGLGKNDHFIDGQEAVWQVLTGGLKTKRKCVELSVDSETTKRT